MQLLESTFSYNYEIYIHIYIILNLKNICCLAIIFSNVYVKGRATQRQRLSIQWFTPQILHTAEGLYTAKAVNPIQSPSWVAETQELE